MIRTINQILGSKDWFSCQHLPIPLVCLYSFWWWCFGFWGDKVSCSPDWAPELGARYLAISLSLYHQKQKQKQPKTKTSKPNSQILFYYSITIRDSSISYWWAPFFFFRVSALPFAFCSTLNTNVCISEHKSLLL